MDAASNRTHGTLTYILIDFSFDEKHNRRPLRSDTLPQKNLYNLIAYRYHGPIPRSHAESLLHDEGQFLIRDSSSGQPGDLVLSVRWRRSHLHFIIAKVGQTFERVVLESNRFIMVFTLQVIVQPHTVYESIQYRLEDEPFDSVSDLVTFYVGSEKPITALTGAKITTPVNRTQPLSLYSIRFGSMPTSPNKQALYCRTLQLGKKKLPQEFCTKSLPRPSATGRLQRRQPSDPLPAPEKPSRIPSQFYPESDPADPTTEDERQDVVASQLPNQSVALPRLRKAKTVDGYRPISQTRESFLDRRSCDLEAEATFCHSPVEARLSFSRPFPSLFDLDNFQVCYAIALLIKVHHKLTSNFVPTDIATASDREQAFGHESAGCHVTPV